MGTFTLTVTRKGAETVDALVPFASKDRARPVLTGVAFFGDRVAATDSYALGTVEIDGTEIAWVGGAGPQEREDSPHVDARELRKALKDVRPGARAPSYTTATLTFDTDAGTVTLEGNGRTAVLPLTEGTFPNVGGLLPDDRTLEGAGHMPAVSAELIGRFAKLAETVAPYGNGPARSAIVAVPSADRPLSSIELRTVDGHTLGLAMPTRTDGADVPAAKAKAAETAEHAAA